MAEADRTDAVPEHAQAPGPQPESAVVEPTTDVVSSGALDPGRAALLSAVLDRLIPASPTGLPAAGALGLAAILERVLATSPALRRTFLEGLTAIDIAGAGPFVSLEPSAQDEVLRRVESAEPAFFSALLNHTYRVYYTHPRVLVDLTARVGYEARPPQPLGHALPPFDETLLAAQRIRAPFWRRPG